MGFFENIDSIEALKAQYVKLFGKVDSADIPALNAEYGRLFTKWRNVHKGKGYTKANPVTYRASVKTKETSADFPEVVKALKAIDGVTVKLDGSWIWVGGNTKPNKDAIKALGCSWSGKRQMWYWKFTEYFASTYPWRVEVPAKEVTKTVKEVKKVAAKTATRKATKKVTAIA